MKAFFANVKLYSRLRFEQVISSILILHLCFLIDVFTSINEINRLRKEINRLLSKGMSKICLKVTIGKNRRSQNSIF